VAPAPTSSAGTVWLTRPHSLASTPESTRPPSSISAVRFGPTVTTSRSTFSNGITIPRRAEGMPIRASSAATTRSQAKSSWHPAPRAAPWTAPTTGFG
jgi:hypothetical protein